MATSEARMAHAPILVKLQRNTPSSGVHPTRHVDWFETRQDKHIHREEANLRIAGMGGERACPYMPPGPILLHTAEGQGGMCVP